MQGFKSFANRVTIPFPAGFNVICGPNGSGKSNVIDALLFVLGTTSARSLRALKLQNLLFNGAKDKKPADFCEVSIYVDNSDNQIPGDKEIKITRRITRSGISIYKMNGRTVTRAKILDIISYANLSDEAYNIILQGDVTRIIEMSPAERKDIINEVSGIHEFDEKKEKASRELEKVELRVRENMIVVAEKQKLVSRLKQEKENAEKYRLFEGELRKSKASLLKKKMKDVKERQGVYEKEILENAKKFDDMGKELNKTDDALQSREKGVLRKSDELVKKSRNIDVLRKIDGINNDILRKRDKISFNEREIERAAMRGASHITKEILSLKHPGVYGTVSSLIEVPNKYSIAIEVAAGKHANDIVVDTDDTAAFCIKHLKERKVGRARFIPLNKIQSRPRKKFDGKCIGYAIDLVKFERLYEPAMNFILGSTLVMDNIDQARRTRGWRIATLDGDLVEPSGVMIGGFYKKLKATGFSAGKELEENENLKAEIEKMESQLDDLRAQEQEETQEVVKLQSARSQEEKELDEYRKRHKEIYEERMVLQSMVSRSRIEKAKLDASMDNLTIELEEFSDVEKFFDQSIEELQERVRRCLIEINQLGPVNLKAIEEFGMTSVEFEQLRQKLDRLLEEKDAVMNIVKDVEKRRFEKFMETFTEISQNFLRIYKDMTSGEGMLRLEEEGNIDTGLVIEANPSGKKIVNLDAMSGGEKTLASLSFLFAVMQHKSAPFYVLDEIDASLDKANTRKIANLIKKYSKTLQFIVITHNDLTIADADKVFGVSIEGGVSKVFGIEMPKG